MLAQRRERRSRWETVEVGRQSSVVAHAAWLRGQQHLNSLRKPLPVGVGELRQVRSIDGVYECSLK